MIVPPEFLFQEILNHGLATLADPEQALVLHDLFRLFPPQFQTEAKNYFTGRKFTVGLNWPREGITLPMIAIINSAANESEKLDALGNEFYGRWVGPTDVEIVDYQGIGSDNVYSIFVSTKDPRETIYLCLAIKAILLLNLDSFLQAGMHNMMINESDLRFTEELAPELTNPRVVSVTCDAYFTVPVTEGILQGLVVVVTPETNPSESEEPTPD